MSDLVAIFSDVHFGIERNSEARLADAAEAIRWMCRTAVEAGATRCVFAGDWFHHRDEVDVRTATVARELAAEVAGSFSRFYLVAGNHDFYYNDSPRVSSAFLLDGIDGLTVVASAPDVIDVNGKRVLLAPWFTDLGDVGRYDAMIGHFEFLGGRMAGGYSKVGHSQSELVCVAPLVFTGHYHLTDDEEVPGSPTGEGTPGGRIVTIGSLYQQDWGDAGDRKRFILFDGTSFSSVYNDLSPKFVNVPYSKISGLSDETVARLFSSAAFSGASVRISAAAGEADHDRLQRLVEVASGVPTIRSVQASGDAAGNAIVESVEDGLQELAAKDVRSYVMDFMEKAAGSMPEYAGIDLARARKEVASYFDGVGATAAME